MSTISTHILDTSRGRPAGGVSVSLEILNAGEGWSPLSQAATDDDGRIKEFVLREAQLGAGTYRLVFSVAQYFESLNQPSFYPEVTVTFLIEAGADNLRLSSLQLCVKHLRGTKTWTRACDALREEIVCFVREKLAFATDRARLDCSLR